MAITVKYLEELGISKEVAAQIFTERGVEIASEKSRYSKLEEAMNSKDSEISKLKTEVDNLTAAGKDAASWKSKYEELEQKEAQAKAEADKKAKSEAIKARFETAKGTRAFNHEAIENAYLEKFKTALDEKDNAGKSDVDILNNLLKDDAGALKNVNVIKLQGGAQKSENEIDENKARAVMGLPPLK